MFGDDTHESGMCMPLRKSQHLQIVNKKIVQKLINTSPILITDKGYCFL